MKLENYVRVIIGGLAFLSSSLGYLYNTNWLWISMFVGLNLFQFGFTGFCPLAIILKRLGVKE